MTLYPRSRPVLTRRQLLMWGGLGATSLLAACSSGSATTPTTASTTTTASSAASTSAAPTATSSIGQAPAAIGGSTATATAASSPAAGASTPGTAATPRAAGTPATSATSNVPKQLQEAPTLADQVKSGKLPPVAERVSQNPVVLTPVERVGKYGGTWRAALVGGQDTLWLDRTIGYENLVRWDTQWRAIIPNLAESFSGTPDAKEFTFKLRQGVKWSDGQPYTTDDIMFWFEDVFQNKELTPNKGNNPPTVTKVDQSTFKVTFAQPDGFFLNDLATASGGTYGNIALMPKHYLQQFHIKYNPQGIDQLIKQNGVDSWVKLFQSKGSTIPGTPYVARWSNADLPTMDGWRITAAYTGSNPQVTAERNPFYWKVDTAGNQLPYIDKVTYAVLQDPQVLVLKAAGGEIDMQDRNLATNQNKAVLTDNQQKGNYHFFETVPSQMNVMIIHLNQTHKNPAMRQLMQNKDFRIGLSYAINRQEIIDTVYVGQGEPWQGAPQRESAYYNEQLAKQYTEYDVAKANASLDKVLPKKDAQGFRLDANGQKLTFTVEVSTSNPDQVDVMKLVQGHWQKVGIDIQVKSEDRSLFYTRKNANEHDANVWTGGGGLDALWDARSFFPFSNESNWAEAWATYFTNPTGAGAQTPPEEPPAPAKQQMDIYHQIETSADQGKQIDLFKQILQIAQEQFYVIGISLISNGYGIVKNNMHNVPAKMFSTGGQWPNPAPTNPCTYFYE